jgi:hypothetical protein
MSLSKTPESEIPDLGSEPLEGSGFEFEEPTVNFERPENTEEEGLVQ